MSSIWPADWQERPIKKAAAAVAALLLVGMFTLPAPTGLKPEAFKVILALGLAMTLWLPEVFPPSFSALVLLFVLPLVRAISFEDSVAGLGNKVIWMLISVSFLTTALNRTGMDRRFAYSVVRRAGGSTAGVILGIIATGFLSAFLIPNAESRTALLVTLSAGLLQALGVEPRRSNLGRAMLLSTSMTALLSSPLVMTGASATIWAVGYFESVLGYHWTYERWLLMMLPGVVLVCLLIWAVVLWLYPPEQRRIEGGLAFIDDELRKMGRLGAPQVKLLGLLALLLSMLLFGDGAGITREMAFMGTGLLLFAPGIAILEWNSTLKQVPWGTLIFFASSLTLSRAVLTTGAAEWVAQQIVSVVSGFPGWAVTVGIMLLFLMLRFVFTNMTSVLSALMPVVTSLAFSTGRSPVWMGMIAVVASGLCLMTPMQSASNIMSYSAGYYEMRDLARAGALVSGGVIIITLLMAQVYWPVFGIHP